MSFTFDGFDLARYALVRIERPVGPSMRVSTENVSGRAGDIVSDCTMDAICIVAHMTLRRSYLHQWEQVRRELSVALTKSGERVLTLPDEPGLWRYATASLSGNVGTPLVPPVKFDIEFVCHDPIAYGDERSVSVPSGGSARFFVAGTMPATVNVIANAAVRNASTNLWGLRLDDEYVLYVGLPDSTAREVLVDCDARVARVSDALSMITLGSRWLTFEPGEHTIEMTQGTGDAVVTWIERSL